jgi:MFS family permease
MSSDTAESPSPEPAPRIHPVRDLVDSFRALRGLKRTFWVCQTVYLLDGAAYFGILNILTLFLDQSLKLPDELGGMFVSYLTGLLTLFLAVLGGMSDRVGVRRTLTLTIIAALVGRVVLTISPHWAPADKVALTEMSFGLLVHQPFTVLRLLGTALSAGAFVALAGLTLQAFSAGVMQAAVYAGVKHSTDERTKAIGFSLVYALMNGGIVAESIASSLVRQKWGPSGVFWMCSGLTVIYLIVHLALFPRSEGNPVIVERPSGGSWRDKALFNPRFLYFIFVLLGVRTLFAHQWLTMPSYVTRAYPPEVGARFEWINGLNPAIILIGTPLVAGLTRRVHVVTMMILGTLVSASATFLLVPGPNLAALLTYVTIFSIGEALWSSRFLEYVADVAPPDKVGAYMGVAQIPWFLAKFTTGFYSGFMLHTYCPADGPKDTGTMWLIYGVIGMTTPIGLVAARKWLSVRLHAEPAAGAA